MPRTFVWHPSKRAAKTREAKPPEAGRYASSRSGAASAIRGACALTLEAIGLKHHQDVVVKHDHARRCADSSSRCATSSR